MLPLKKSNCSRRVATARAKEQFMVSLSLTAEQIDQLRNIAAVGGKWLMAAFTALGGLAGIAKIITTFVARKKPVKLNQSDYEAIANAIVDKTNGSIEINMSSEIDKATRNRLTEVEKVNGELVKACKQLVKAQKAIANAVSDFKTISTSARDELNHIAKLTALYTELTGIAENKE